jgi:hypothetical protein
MCRTAIKRINETEIQYFFIESLARIGDITTFAPENWQSGRLRQS